MVSLFRPEVIEGRRHAWLGSIQLVRPVSLGVLTWLVLGIAVAIGVFLAEGSYTRRARLTGVLVPDLGTLWVMPSEAGVVTDVRVAEGRRVERDEVLFVVSVDRPTAGGGTHAAIQQSLAVRRASLQEAVQRTGQLAQSQGEALERQLADMRRELAQMDAEADVVRQQLALKQQDVAQYEALMHDESFVSPAHLRTRRAEMLQVRERLETLSLRRAVHARELAALEARRREQPLQAAAARGEIERELAALAAATAENQGRQELEVRAPQAGIVTSVIAHRGQNVTPAAAVAAVLPAQSQLQAHLYAPSSAVGFLKPQQDVQLRYQAFPYQKFGHHPGRVLEVSRTPLQGPELAGVALPDAMRASPSAEPLYRITVGLQKQSVPGEGPEVHPLLSGMRLDADVLLERRRLIQWLFEPLLSVAGRV